MLHDNCLCPHYLKHIPFQHHVHPAEEQLLQLSYPRGPLRRAIPTQSCLCNLPHQLSTSFLQQILFNIFSPFSEVRQTLCWELPFEQLQVLREIQMFLPIPYNHTVFLFHTILQLSSQCISSTVFFFHLWSRKLFSPFLLPPTICSFYFLRTGKAVTSPGDELAPFHSVSFGDCLAVLKAFFFSPSPLQVDGEEEGRF